jgi:WD40 repeat protein
MSEPLALTPIPEPRPDRKLDVVFVHGLGDNDVKAWQQKDEPKNLWLSWLASNDGKLTFWPHWLAGHTSTVRAVAVTPDGRRAVSASDDHTLKVWELEAGRELHTLAGNTNGVWAVAVTPDGRRAVSASDDHTLQVWELETGAPIRTFSCDAPTRCCAVPNGWTIIAGDTGGRVHILALEM